MFDHDDADAFEIAGLLAVGWPAAVVLLAIALAVHLIASSNEDDCSKLHCDRGAPKLTSHECVCTERAK
jgi:hypothetical protein